MRLLLDSNAVVRWMTAPRMLPGAVHAAIQSGANDALISAVAAYELEFKQNLGKLPLLLPPDWRSDLARAGFAWLAVSDSHAARAARLPLHHRDPWDRLIVAQALEDGLTIITGDRQIHVYGAPVLW